MKLIMNIIMYYLTFYNNKKSLITETRWKETLYYSIVVFFSCNNRNIKSNFFVVFVQYNIPVDSFINVFLFIIIKYTPIDVHCYLIIPSFFIITREICSFIWQSYRSSWVKNLYRIINICNKLTFHT